jgi:hypothetical protein
MKAFMLNTTTTEEKSSTPTVWNVAGAEKSFFFCILCIPVLEAAADEKSQSAQESKCGMCCSSTEVDSLPSARRHGVFGYPKQSATVSVYFVLK